MSTAQAWKIATDSRNELLIHVKSHESKCQLEIYEKFALYGLLYVFLLTEIISILCIYIPVVGVKSYFHKAINYDSDRRIRWHESRKSIHFMNKHNQKTSITRVVSLFLSFSFENPPTEIYDHVYALEYV